MLLRFLVKKVKETATFDGNYLHLIMTSTENMRSKTERVLSVEKPPKEMQSGSNESRDQNQDGMLFEFKSEISKKVFDALVNFFIEDYMVKKYFAEKSGWRTLAEISEKAGISPSTLYGKQSTMGHPLDDPIRRGLIEKRISTGERGRGGEVVRLRIAYEKEPVKEYVNVKVRSGSTHAKVLEKTVTHSQSSKSSGLSQLGDRRLAAIMFTDIVGYTSLTQTDEKLALDLLEEHRKMVRPLLIEHDGREIKTIGDSFLIEFRSALQAVNCAVEMQRAFAVRNSESESKKRFQVRIGIHSGDVVGLGADVYGDTVNIASRIEALSQPGGVTISSQVYEQVKNRVTLPFENLGQQKLKNIETPMEVYKLESVTKLVPALETPDKQRRFAILPLVNIGQEEDYLADGLTEELFSAFSHLSTLKVVARTTMMKYKGMAKSISDIGRELNVATVLEGSVRKYGKRLRVTVQLVETKSEEYVWSEVYDQGIEDILDVQHDVAEKTLSALKTRLGEKAGPGAKIAARKITENPDAFLLYLKGKYHLARHTESEVRLAIDLFDQAVHLDPNFAAARAMYAQCQMFLAFFGFIEPTEGFERAMPPLRKAIEIERDLDIAHMLLGRLYQDKWDFHAAEVEFRRAIEISPNSSEAHYRYALLLNDQERSDEALGQIKIAEELDPLSVPVNQIAGTVMYFAGKYPDAIERFQRAIDIDPQAVLAQNNLGLAEFEEGKVDQGIAQVKKAVAMDPNNTMLKVDLCHILCRSGRESEARNILNETLAKAMTQHVPPVALAGMHACLGEKEKTIECLERAFFEHSPYLASLRVERWFENIRTDPKFQSIVRRMRPEHQMH